MKRLILGDIHGHYETVEQIYNREQPDEVILIGDYVDSFGVSTDAQYDNFQKLLELRIKHIEANKGQFIMLLGNHDFHYIVESEKYSGWNWRTNSWAHNTLNGLLDNKIITKIFVDRINKTIYSHAGVSNYWFKKICTNETYKFAEIHEMIPEDIENFDLKDFCHNTSLGNSATGNTIANSPIWIRPYALSTDMYEDDEGNVWEQIVGHTSSSHIYNVSSTVNRYDGKILVIDALPKEYVVETLSDNGKLINREIKENV